MGPAPQHDTVSVEEQVYSRQACCLRIALTPILKIGDAHNAASSVAHNRHTHPTMDSRFACATNATGWFPSSSPLGRCLCCEPAIFYHELQGAECGQRVAELSHNLNNTGGGNNTPPPLLPPHHHTHQGQHHHRCRKRRYQTRTIKAYTSHNIQHTTASTHHWHQLKPLQSAGPPRVQAFRLVSK